MFEAETEIMSNHKLFLKLSICFVNVHTDWLTSKSIHILIEYACNQTHSYTRLTTHRSETLQKTCQLNPGLTRWCTNTFSGSIILTGGCVCVCVEDGGAVVSTGARGCNSLSRALYDPADLI